MREKQNTPDKKNQKNALTPLVIQSELWYNAKHDETTVYLLAPQ